jgi:hypothetical protein
MRVLKKRGVANQVKTSTGVEKAVDVMNVLTIKINFKKYN